MSIGQMGWHPAQPQLVSEIIVILESILNLFKRFQTILNRFEPFWIILNQYGSFWMNSNNFQNLTIDLQTEIDSWVFHILLFWNLIPQNALFISRVPNIIQVCREKMCMFRYPKSCKFDINCKFFKRNVCVYKHINKNKQEPA